MSQIMKTYNQFLETPFSEETAPPAEEKKPDAALTGKQKRATQIKKQVLMKKLQAVRAGSEDIVAHHEPEGEVLDERLGGKGYKPYTSLTGKKVSGDWEDSDRGAGNKAKKRAGGKVEKKSPTYRAHVLNKKKVNEGTDKAFEYVKKQIAAKYGKSGYVSKDNPRKPQTDAEKAKARAHQAKVDKENAAERAKDPSQGRYPKG